MWREYKRGTHKAVDVRAAGTVRDIWPRAVYGVCAAQQGNLIRSNQTGELNDVEWRE